MERSESGGCMLSGSARVGIGDLLLERDGWPREVDLDGSGES
jgi:hypothetical protein